MYSKPFALYTLEHSGKHTEQVLCGQHNDDRLDALEEDGYRVAEHKRAPQGAPCEVCREYEEQTAAERRANTQ